MKTIPSIDRAAELAKSLGFEVERLAHPATAEYKAGGIVVHPCPSCRDDYDAIILGLTGGGVAASCQGCQDPGGIISVLVESSPPAPPGSTNGRPRASVTGGTPLVLYTPEELRAMPKPRFLVDPFIPEHALVVLFGAQKTYKSFVAIAMAAQVDGLVVYVAAEGDPSRFGDRITAWETATTRSARILTHPYAVNLLGDSYEDLRATLHGLDEAARMLVFDTLARNTPGADENSTQDTGRVINVCDQLRAEFQCAVLLLAHSGHDHPDRPRGSSALGGALDVSIRTKRVRPLEVRLECAEVRDFEEFDPRIMRLVPTSGSLVAVGGIPRPEVVEQDVRAYLAAHPDASQRQVEKNVVGKTDLIRATYRRVRPPRPKAGRTPGSGAPQGVRL